jgi:hypothetical protein
MNKCMTLLVSALLAVIVVQWFGVSRLRSENRALRYAQEQAQPSRSELNHPVRPDTQHEAEAQSLRIEVPRLRGEVQRASQILEPAAASQRPTTTAPQASGPEHPPETMTGLNQALAEFIGEPVEPPVNLDLRYTKKGIIGAVQLAAQNAGVTVQRVEVEGSEYPFLVGVFCEPQAYAKLSDEINKLDGYVHSSGVGGQGVYTVSITPPSAYPEVGREQIEHRLMLRLQVFYKSLRAQK